MCWLPGRVSVKIRDPPPPTKEGRSKPEYGCVLVNIWGRSQCLRSGTSSKKLYEGKWGVVSLLRGRVGVWSGEGSGRVCTRLDAALSTRGSLRTTACTMALISTFGVDAGGGAGRRVGNRYRGGTGAVKDGCEDVMGPGCDLVSAGGERASLEGRRRRRDIGLGEGMLLGSRIRAERGVFLHVSSFVRLPPSTMGGRWGGSGRQFPPSTEKGRKLISSYADCPRGK